MVAMKTKGRVSLASLVLLVNACWLEVAQGFTPSTTISIPFQSSTSKYHQHQHQYAHSSALSMVDDSGLSLLDRRSVILGTMSSLLFSSAVTSTAANPALATTTLITPKIPEWTLQGNVQFPTLALNTVGLSSSDTTHALNLAIQSGITHVDFHPGKERDGVAAYLAQNPSQRPNLFLNTKIRKAPPGTSPSDAALLAQQQIQDDLRILNVNQVDMLMLRDSPDCAVMQAQWKVLEQALKDGTTRSIGVINFCQSALECVLQTAVVKPAINYYMLHVGMGRDAHGLRTFGESRGIRTFAYGAVGEPGPNIDLFESGILKRIGDVHGKSVEEVAVRWVLQGGAAVSVRPTTEFGLGVSTCSNSSSKCEAGLKMRAGSFGWSLSEEAMKELDGMTSPDDNPTLFSSAGCPNAFGMPQYVLGKLRK
jgi:2,5-diketo-D-gluconate reductase A